MIGDAAVGEAKLLAVVGLVGAQGGDFFVHVYAEAGFIGREGEAFFIVDAAAVEEVFPILFVATVGDFLD